MNKNEENVKSTNENLGSSKENYSVKSKPKNRGKKRKRGTSESSSDYEDVLPENTLEVEKSLHASAIKNNLDETSVRKILKKVVTNDRVLALVKLREEAENLSPEDNSLRPKLTRAKVKELRRVSPKTAAWNLQNLELSPIKHIPVKTRPEVKALIAQELPEDEDDEEYEPTNEEVPSDDDHMESCSDLDSQPRTPATPRSQNSTSPKVIKDGPFKVPQDISTPTRRKLDLEEEATIALRTRSKLSLSATSIEHIESTFVPPDDLPMPAVDDLWNEFLSECLNPASTSKNEDDDETDPEYNVAADADAHDEDEEALSNSIIKISKKELNDLVTELFNIIPETSAEDDLTAHNIANSVLTENSQTEVPTRWEGKQEPLSDDENGDGQKLSDRITFEKNSSAVAIEKTEPVDRGEENKVDETPETEKGANSEKVKQRIVAKSAPPVVKVAIEEQFGSSSTVEVPLLLQRHLQPVKTEYVVIQVGKGATVLPEQIQILQQQLRQHIQLTTSNFLQLCVHPIHWPYSAQYKGYLETFMKLGKANPKSVVNVCNLKPAVELVTTWEKTVTACTAENDEMVNFVRSESERCFRRGTNKNLYVGEFHETFKKVVANSPVFLYPYLLPSMPYRADNPRRRFCYLQSEDELIALGLDQFWRYVVSNPSIYKPRRAPNPRHRWGLGITVQLVIKHMFPWIPGKVMHGHIQTVRKVADKDNPIYKYFETLEVTPVKHKLLPYNPQMTLYEQPEFEVPRIWLRYLAKTSKRFRSHLNKRTNKTGIPPRGVDIEMGQAVIEPSKVPLPIDFTKKILSNRLVISPPTPKPPLADKFDIQIQNNGQKDAAVASTFYKFVETSTGAFLVPYTSGTMTVYSNTGPISTPAEIHNMIEDSLPETAKTNQKVRPVVINSEHCTCCILLRKICKLRQAVITEYFGTAKPNKVCGCKGKRYPKVSNRLRLLVNNYKTSHTCALQALKMKLKKLKGTKNNVGLQETNYSDSNIDDLAYVTSFHLKLLTLTAIAKDNYLKKKVHTLLSRFNPYEHDPLSLAAQLDQAFGNEQLDLYKEFLGFLTPEQVDKLDAYKAYFIKNCVTDLIKKVEEEVKDVKKLRNILEEIQKVFLKNLSTACEICTDILYTLDGYPKLAEYVYSLFPHRKEKGPEQKDVMPLQKTPQLTEKPLEETSLCDNSIMMQEATMDIEANRSMSPEQKNVMPLQKTPQPTEKPLEETAPCENSTMMQEATMDIEADQSISPEQKDVMPLQKTPQPTEKPLEETAPSENSTIMQGATMDIEADQSTSEEEDANCRTKNHSELEINDSGNLPIKIENISPEDLTPTSESVTLVITVSKTEFQDFSESSNTSMNIMLDDEIIKSEGVEWKRDEDKLILEILKEHLTPEERHDKTILEIIQEKSLIEIISESLTNKSKDDIKTRLFYLLQIC